MGFGHAQQIIGIRPIIGDNAELGTPRDGELNLELLHCIVISN
jgi:hypothetical protein